MTTLTEFLLARIAEDEAVAAKAHSVAPGREPEWLPPEVYNDSEYGLAPFVDVSAHRFLAECEAKRRLVTWMSAWQADVALEGLTLLALPYADHPDYGEARAQAGTATPYPGDPRADFIALSDMDPDEAGRRWDEALATPTRPFNVTVHYIDDAGEAFALPPAD